MRSRWLTVATFALFAAVFLGASVPSAFAAPAKRHLRGRNDSPPVSGDSVADNNALARDQ